MKKKKKKKISKERRLLQRWVFMSGIVREYHLLRAGGGSLQMQGRLVANPQLRGVHLRRQHHGEQYV